MIDRWGRAFLIALLALATNASDGQSAPPSKLAVSRGDLISTEGDSLTYGMDVSPSGKRPPINGATFTRSTDPYPETLGRDLGGCAAVVNRGFPGDRSVDGLVRWQKEPPANVAVLMYGSNDATNFGHAATGTVTVDLYKQVMRLMIERHQAMGSQIILLIPPPIEEPYVNRLIEPYRAAVRALGEEMKLMVLDPADALSSLSPIFTPDHVHLTAAANIAIAKMVQSHIECR